MVSVLEQFRVIPVCGLSSPAEAEPLGEALRAGGLPIVEITLRTPDALECLAAMARVKGVLVGAGTVRTGSQFAAAVAAGADFIVSPFLTRSLVRESRRVSRPFLPGTATPTEVQNAVEAGFDTVKFFPAEASGGVAALGAIADVFPEISFVPTGGISDASAPGYLAHPQVLAVGGGWMLPAAARRGGDWEAVSRSIAACVSAIHGGA